MNSPETQIGPISYIIITPAYNEQKYIEQTLRSVVIQTKKPKKWIIANDGSTDKTGEIVSKYAEQFPWIKMIDVCTENRNKYPYRKIYAFNASYETLKNEAADLIVNLDADLAFDSEYFEILLLKFAANPKLGIASGALIEKRNGNWTRRRLLQFQDGDGFHTAGASKVYRRKCLEDIGGLAPVKGWDTLDEIRAHLKGWETSSFSDCWFYHLRGEGSRSGSLKTSFVHGEISYTTGSSMFFFLMKCVHRAIVARPIILCGIWTFIGFMKSLLKRKPLIVNEAERTYYRNQQLKRIWHFLRSGRNARSNHFRRSK